MSGSGADDEVKLKLSLEGGAAEGVKLVGAALEHAGHHAGHLTSELMSIAKQAVATAAGFQLNASIEGMKEFGKEIFDAARNAGAETKAIAGILAVNDQTDASWEQLTDRAKEYHERLEDITVETGSMNEQVQEAFGAIAARSGQSADKVADLVATMAEAGRGVKGGIGALSEGFAMIELGAIRARNPVVQLIAQSHLLQGNAKQVAAQLQKMKPEEALALGERAIERMADKMKDVKPTFGEAINSLKGMREQVLETLGAPLVSALGKPLQQFSKFLKENRHAMEEYASAAGTKIGEWVTDAAHVMQDGFHYLQDHADEIKNALKEGWGYAKAVLDAVLAHKDLLKLGLAYGAASKLVGAVGGAPAVGAIGKLATGVGGEMGLAGAAATAAGLAALAAAAIAAAGALYLIERTEKVKRDTTEAAGGVASSVAMQAMGGGDVSKMLAGFREVNPALESTFSNIAMGTAALIYNFGDMEQTMREVNGVMGMTRDEFSAFENLMNLTAETTREATQALIDQASEGMGAIEGGNLTGVSSIVDAYNSAEQTHNAAAMQFAAETLLASGFTADGLKESGMKLAGGFAEFDALFGKASEQTLAQLKAFHGGGEGGKLAPAHVSVGGGNTINIKQDFRDTDPDRIALIMRRDVIRAAESRRQSRVSTPFGL